MDSGAPESSAQPVAGPSKLSAHLERFRRPTSPRRSSRPPSPRKTVFQAASTTALLPPSPPPKLGVKRKQRETATPPRPCPRLDGTSPHFKRLASSLGDESFEEAERAPAKEGGEDTDEADTPQKKKKKRPIRGYADPSVYAHLGEDPLTDYMMKDGRLMLCGINPGKKSAEEGLHYANPTNHYWKCLAGSGLTDRLLAPSEGALLPDKYGISATNLVSRPSIEMSEISNDEMKASVPTLLRKIVKYRPRMIGFVGMKICEVVLRYLHNLPCPPVPGASPSKRKPAMPKVKIGLQPVTLTLPPEHGEREEMKVYIWCLPSTSARVVEYQLVDKVELFTNLRLALGQLEADPPIPLQLPDGTVNYPANRLFPPEIEQVEAEEEDEQVKPEEADAQVKEEEEEGAWRVTLVKAEDVKQE
ncbi:hypothetical protein JCM8547_001506 [Rhodosporidiobolus lusitaniae]